ncbi:hypothetical protein EVAR_65975_1 [Eumeta japonica]|uniref:Uncharacterized protein n=1 Tax=Eumeta variegata TaxID=151549 RepID=A0A4C2A2I4_EUMVA|nr:hypothetical protein EVAR_65975_1 [Eumeta japonica]
MRRYDIVPAVYQLSNECVPEKRQGAKAVIVPLFEEKGSRQESENRHTINLFGCGIKIKSGGRAESKARPEPELRTGLGVKTSVGTGSELKVALGSELKTRLGYKRTKRLFSRRNDSKGGVQEDNHKNNTVEVDFLGSTRKIDL